jgi:hypothetical protein
MGAVTLFAAAVIGLTVGLFGSGGSILTVPVLVLWLGMPEKQAIQLALGIVALISLVAVLPHWRAGRISWHWLVRLAGPGVLGALVGGALSPLLASTVQLVLLALLMLLSSWNMWRREPWRWQLHSGPLVLLLGLVLGMLTGLVGVGGGFLLVPVLLALSNLTPQQVVATSLMLVLLQSASGFASQSLAMARLPDLTTLLMFGGIGAAGSLLALLVLPLVPQLLFRRSFALLLPVLATALIWQHWA